MSSPATSVNGPRTRLGRGRSGIVFEAVGSDGERYAHKVFRPDTASRWVMTLLTGAANPYRWCEDAVATAVLRRRIMEGLVPSWFGEQLRLPRTAGSSWNEDHDAYELAAERIRGRHAMLAHDDAPGEVGDLVHSIMRPLQRHLAEAGFDGLLWQAGLGNPVATANFMREGDHWVWIDLESGVPALFPLNPWRLVRNYLPLSIKHRRWLFDDVDVDRLRDYVTGKEEDLRFRLGDVGWRALLADIEELGERQDAWRALRRHQRSLMYHVARGTIDREEARAYWNKPVRWLTRLGLRSAGSALKRIARIPGWLAGKLAWRPLFAATVRVMRFFLSQEVRTRWANIYVRRRVVVWRERGFLSREPARRIRSELASAEHLADFGVHLALKPLFKLFQWGLVPALYAAGVITSGWLTAALVLGGGAIGRTIYTLFRAVQRRSVPWVALLVGALPMIGNAAYPVQLLADSSRREGFGARFLVRDIVSGIGRRFPIWGGRDTQLEHWANGVAGLVARG